MRACTALLYSVHTLAVKMFPRPFPMLYMLGNQLCPAGQRGGRRDFPMYIAFPPSIAPRGENMEAVALLDKKAGRTASIRGNHPLDVRVGTVFVLCGRNMA